MIQTKIPTTPRKPQIHAHVQHVIPMPNMSWFNQISFIFMIFVINIVTAIAWMFFESLVTMLHKENLSEYLVSKLSMLKLNPSLKLDSYLVQAFSSELLTDGSTNFMAKFIGGIGGSGGTKSPNKVVLKGSVLRLVEWTLDLKTFELVVFKWQYLGGAGYSVRAGRPWDIEKLKLITNSDVISKDFIVLYNPVSNQNQQHNTQFKVPSSKESFFCFDDKVQSTENREQIKRSLSIPQKSYSQPVLRKQAHPPKIMSLWPQPTPSYSPPITIPQLPPKLKVSSSSPSFEPNTSEWLATRRKEQLARDLSQQATPCVNEDSLGRKLVFNKDQIKKLLGHGD